MSTELIISHLRKARQQIDQWKESGIKVRDSAEFAVWKADVEKWLHMGSFATSSEHNNFISLVFAVLRMRIGESGYDGRDAEQFQKDLALAEFYIDSAIENLQHGLVHPAPRRPESRKTAERGDVHVTTNVTLNNMTVLNMFDAMREKIEKLPDDTPDKKTLLKSINEIVAHPLFILLANTGLTALLPK